MNDETTGVAVLEDGEIRQGNGTAALPFPWDAPLTTAVTGERVSIRRGAAVLLDLIPKRTTKFEVARVALLDVMRDGLRPLGALPDARGWHARNAHGEVVFKAPQGTSPPPPQGPFSTLAASMITLRGSLHGVDVRILGPDVFEACVPAVVIEDMLLGGLDNLLDAAERLHGPREDYAARAAISGVAGRRLALGTISDTAANLGGVIATERIEETFAVDIFSDLQEALRPFFERLHDAAGETYQDIGLRGSWEARPLCRPREAGIHQEA